MNVYERIKDLCIEREITIAALERQLRFSKGSISKWIESYPNSAYLMKAADYFGVSTDYLLGISNVKIKYLEKIDEEHLRFITKVQELGLDKEMLSTVLNDIEEKYINKKNLTNT